MSLSKAGKQKMQLDKRARQLNDTIDAACTKRALAVLIENVVELMDLNEVHGMMTAADDKASRGGLTRVKVWRKDHAKCGGGSQRTRVFPLWLHREVVAREHRLTSWSIMKNLARCESTCDDHQRFQTTVK